MVLIKLLGSSLRRSVSTDELITSMAIGRSGCFQEGIKFLSDEQQFGPDVPSRLLAYANATLEGAIEYIRQ